VEVGRLLTVLRPRPKLVLEGTSGKVVLIVMSVVSALAVPEILLRDSELLNYLFLEALHEVALRRGVMQVSWSVVTRLNFITRD